MSCVSIDSSYGQGRISFKFSPYFTVSTVVISVGFSCHRIFVAAAT
jgi:hypothetical protein